LNNLRRALREVPTGCLRLCQNRGKNKQRQRKKQIPPLRCGMTNKYRRRRNAGILRCAQNDNSQQGYARMTNHGLALVLGARVGENDSGPCGGRADGEIAGAVEFGTGWKNRDSEVMD
jgi:hypothetical protein